MLRGWGFASGDRETARLVRVAMNAGYRQAFETTDELVRIRPDGIGTLTLSPAKRCSTRARGAFNLGANGRTLEEFRP